MSLAQPGRRRSILIGLLSTLLIAGCGGGGGDSAPPPSAPSGAPPASNPPPAPTPSQTFADGLGAEGRAPGTIQIGTAHAPGTVPFNRFIGPNSAGTALIVQNSIAVSDAGEVLAVWAERTSIDNPAFSNQGTVNATSWGSAIPLPQIANLAEDLDWGLPLRMNTGGDAVVGWTEPSSGPSVDFQRQSRLLRYMQGTGWSATAVNLRSSVGPLFGHIGSSDLQLLDDGMVAFSELDTPPGTSHRIYRQTGSNAPAALPDVISPITSLGRVSIATNGLGRGAGTWVDGNNVQFFSVDIAGGQVFPPAILATPSSFCTSGVRSTVYTRLSYIAASSERFSVQAFNTADSNTRCFLQLLAWDLIASTLSVTSTTPGTFVLQPPVLAVDPAGNGVAVWQELNRPTPSDPETITPVWSQSALGNTWSAPQAIGANGTTVGVPDINFPIRFALNRAGQGVAALVVFRDGTRFIATARYSVASLWTDWSLIASAPDFSVPNVAISESGDAFLIYAAQPCTRSGSPPVPGLCGDTQNIYVLKVPG